MNCKTNKRTRQPVNELLDYGQQPLSCRWCIPSLVARIRIGTPRGTGHFGPPFFAMDPGWRFRTHYVLLLVHSCVFFFFRWFLLSFKLQPTLGWTFL